MNKQLIVIFLSILATPPEIIADNEYGSTVSNRKSDTVFIGKRQEETFFVYDEDINENHESDNEPKMKTRGFIDTYHAVKTEGKGEWMSSRTRVRGEFTLKKREIGMFISMNAIYNGIIKSRTGLELREAYLFYNRGNIDFRAGRQIIIWGIADALRITDRISPMDYSEFIAQDYDDIRIPVNAFRLKFVRAEYNLEFVCIPVGNFFILPTDTDNPWAFNIDGRYPYNFDLDSQKPEIKFSNMELGGRLGIYSSGIDFSVCVLHTWNKMPAFKYSLNAYNSLTIIGNYRRMTMIGTDFSMPADKVVIRGEGAVFFNEAQNSDFGHNVKSRNSINIMMGIDWYPGHEWNLSIQYSHKHIAGNLDGLSVPKNSDMATFRISKEFFRNTLKCQSFAYIDVKNKGIFNRFSLGYDLNDQISITGGYDYFHADKGIFKMYRHNSEVWIKLKYGF